jgi:Meiotically up-regulated gene 113
MTEEMLPPPGVFRRVNPSGDVRYYARVRGGGKTFSGPSCATIDEAASYLPAVRARAAAQAAQRRTRRANGRAPEVIYLIQTESGPIKVGRAKASVVERRLANLQIACWEPLRLLGTLPSDSQDEREIHRRFAHVHIRGEWFADDPALRALIERRPRWLGRLTERVR